MFKPSVETPMRKAGTLRETIRTERSMNKLAKILDENKIACIGVHPFFITWVKGEFRPNAGGTEEYKAYYAHIVELMTHPSIMKKTTWVLEDPRESIKFVSAHFKEYKQTFSPARPIFFSPNGPILEYAKVDDDLFTQEIKLVNMKNNAYEKLIARIVESDGKVLVFGMSKSYCVKKAVQDIEKIAKQNGLEAQIYFNEQIVRG